MEPSNFTANCAKIAQFAAQTMNHAKSVQFLLNHTNPCSPTVPQPFYSKSREIRSIRREINKFRTNFNKSSVLFYRLS